MLLIKTYLDKSPIEGVGVFADEPIAKGTPIWAFHPLVDIILSPEQLAGLSEPFKAFVNKVSIPSHIDPRDVCLALDNANYMNHSDSPNVVGEDTGVAAWDIPKGTELTVSYYDEGFTDLPWKTAT